jgi:hypothetical protein
VTGVISVIPANSDDLPVTTEHESAAIESGATDASRPAGFIRARRSLLDGLRIPLQQETVVPRTSRRTGPPARTSLRHIRGTRFLTAAAQRAGTIRSNQESLYARRIFVPIWATTGRPYTPDQSFPAHRSGVRGDHVVRAIITANRAYLWEFCLKSRMVGG